MITLRQVEAFKLVMEAGTMLRAAEHMGLSQPAVSRLIGDLERGIGYLLFDRRKGRIIPRREANALLDEVERAFVGLASIAEAAQRIGRNSNGIVRIAALPAFHMTPLARNVAQFLDAHPNVFFSLNSRSRPQLLEETAEGRHDIAFATGPIERPDLGARTILETEYQLLVPLNHPLSAHDTVDLSELDGVELITSVDPTPGQSRIDQALRDAGVRSSARIETTTAHLAHALVSEGVGVCLTLRPFAEHVQLPGTRALSFRPPLPVDIVAVYPADQPPDAVATSFVRHFADSFQNADDWRARATPQLRNGAARS